MYLQMLNYTRISSNKEAFIIRRTKELKEEGKIDRTKNILKNVNKLGMIKMS